MAEDGLRESGDHQSSTIVLAVLGNLSSERRKVFEGTNKINSVFCQDFLGQAMLILKADMRRDRLKLDRALVLLQQAYDYISPKCDPWPEGRGTGKS